MEIRNRALQAKEMQTSITYQRQQNTNVNKMPKLTKYQRRQIININKMPTSTKCQRQQNANVNKMPTSTKCQRQQNVFYYFSRTRTPYSHKIRVIVDHRIVFVSKF